ncbi:membrane-associated tyrosine- and threonine-specific cdc2-inhibitory kinase isoform X2 [Thrips palmi]|uniref:non-specific serine/threonine protein kinase n=1 Tax=Thrips palmi TaxID=161013 RepID=A0A6P9A3E3_THRPL|nr:membrane-associated tyrosine- and threonine-specific cdc2-inhibitory kinase isoform X2 [Thrips palmi]
MALKEDSLCLEGHGSLFGNCFSFDAEDSFQRKKDVETTTKTPVPPKTPVKFSPWFRVPREASLVTFKQDRSKCLPLSSLYDRHRRDVNYMHQVFKDVTQVGEGHFGKVYRVISKEDNKVYAVKVSKEIFHNEAERLKRSEEVRKHEMIPVHQNCVRLYNAWEEQGRLFLWLEFCQTSLEAYAGTNHEINESKVWEILLDLLLGLKNLHDNRLVHVDVKLENILMTAEGVCKLADFGLLVDMSQDALPPKNVVEGDGRYLAPELLDGGPCTPAVDVFSLGLCILELAADIVMPGGGEDWQSLRRGEIPLTKTTHLSEELKNIIREMLIPNHLERPNVDKLLKQPRLQQMWCERRKRNPTAQDLKAPMTEVLRRKCGRPDRVLRRPVVSSLFGSKSIMKRRLINTSAPRPLSGTWNMQVSDDELEVATILNEGKLDILASSTPFKPPTPTRSRAIGSLLSSQRTLNFALNDSASSSSPTSSPPTSPTSSRFFPQLRSTSPLNSVGENPPASPVSMDESPCASPDFSLLHHSNSSKESKMNNSMPHDLPAHKSLNGSVASLGRMGRNLLHSFNTSEDSDDEKVQKKKEKKRKEKKRR